MDFVATSQPFQDGEDLAAGFCGLLGPETEFPFGVPDHLRGLGIGPAIQDATDTEPDFVGTSQPFQDGDDEFTMVRRPSLQSFTKYDLSHTLPQSFSSSSPSPMCTPCLGNTTRELLPFGIIARRGRLVRRVPSPLVRVRHSTILCAIDTSLCI
jgi:hypothetical protein